MDLGLTDKVALVTGASRGLGLAIATRLAQEGAHVAVGARRAESLASARRQVDGSGPGQAMACQVDVSDPASIQAFANEVARRFGAIHVVVANAGGPPPGPATAFDLGAYRDAFALSALGLIGVAQATLPHLRSAGWGRLILVASETVAVPLREYALSTTVRRALVGYAEALVGDLGAAGITVNVLAPGYHRTPLIEERTDERTRRAIANRIPLGRLGQPEELAATAAFLASEHAGFITGTTLFAHGGGTRG
jgi:3-oxoacyl-[acyl-carrier protein] reductase